MKLALRLAIYFGSLTAYPLRLDAPTAHFELRLLAGGEIWLLTTDLCLNLAWRKRSHAAPPSDFHCKLVRREYFQEPSPPEQSRSPFQIQKMQIVHGKGQHLYLPQWQILILKHPRAREIQSLLRGRLSPQRLIVIGRHGFQLSNLPVALRARTLILQTQNSGDEIQKWGEFRFELRPPTWKPGWSHKRR